MDDGPPDFDAADLADAILGTDPPPTSDPATPPPPAARAANRLGWVLLSALVVALSVAVALAFTVGEASPQPRCGGLFSDDRCCYEPGSACCEDGTHRESCCYTTYDDDPCCYEADAAACCEYGTHRSCCFAHGRNDCCAQPVEAGRRGLFDAEDNFADPQRGYDCEP